MCWLQAADCGKVTMKECKSTVKTRQVQAWMTAGQTVLAMQAVCLGAVLVVRWGASKAIGILQIGPNTLASRTSIFTMLSALLTLLMAYGLTPVNRTKVTLEEERGFKIISLALVAAESCMLLCVDWACAFLVLVLVVPIWLLQPMVNVKLLVLYTSILFAWSASLIL